MEHTAEEIFEPNNKFNFAQLILSPPTSILGGNYFIKFNVNSNPLYIQSPKCTTKNGIVKAGKKMYCDLMMSNDHENFIQWMENLENYVQEQIYNNRAKWFETELEKHDIESSFTSPVKIYKSGKFYITRTNVPVNLGKCSLKIYDENECDVNIESIKDTTNIITILQVQGIKCSARSFQIEIELKQMMVLKPTNLFEKCIIKTHSQEPNSNLEIFQEPKTNLEIFQEPENVESISLGNIQEKLKSQLNEMPVIQPNLEIEQTTTLDLDTNQSDDIFTIQTKKIVDQSNEIVEVEFNLDEVKESETIQLKTRNDIYYQMYRDAKKKAKVAKQLALSTYLEAKNIKNTYMLNDIEDSESDLDESEIKS